MSWVNSSREYFTVVIDLLYLGAAKRRPQSLGIPICEPRAPVIIVKAAKGVNRTEPGPISKARTRLIIVFVTAWTRLVPSRNSQVLE